MSAVPLPLLRLLLALAGAAISFAPVVRAHAWLVEPPSRNFLSLGNKFALSSGTGGLLDGPVDNAHYKNSYGLQGPCGDPHYDRQDRTTTTTNSAGRTFGVPRMYDVGATFNVRVALSINYGGVFRMRLCPRKNSLNPTCFDKYLLNRADTGKPNYYILDGTFTERNASNPHYFDMQYQLPSRISCPRGCVVQWEYMAYNSCVEPCPAEECSFYAWGANNITGHKGPLDKCFNPTHPAVVKDCADILINDRVTSSRFQRHRRLAGAGSPPPTPAPRPITTTSLPTPATPTRNPPIPAPKPLPTPVNLVKPVTVFNMELLRNFAVQLPVTCAATNSTSCKIYTNSVEIATIYSIGTLSVIPYFYVTNVTGALVMMATTSGDGSLTTPGSPYARSELQHNVKWDLAAVRTARLFVTMAVDVLPTATGGTNGGGTPSWLFTSPPFPRPGSVAIAQIKGGRGEIALRYEGNPGYVFLMVAGTNDPPRYFLLNSTRTGGLTNITLGDRFDVNLDVERANNTVRAHLVHQGTTYVASIPITSLAGFFNSTNLVQYKTGAYVQAHDNTTNPARLGTGYGQVSVFNVTATITSS